MDFVATPLWGNCEVATHTPENGTWESSGIPENSKCDCRAQKTLHWGVLGTVGKVLKCRCPKWFCMSHLDICITSYGQKKGRESNCQVKLAVWLPTTKSRESIWFWLWCVQVKCDTLLESSRRELQLWFRPRPDPNLGWRVMSVQSPGSPNRDSFGIPLWGVPRKKAIWMQVWRRTAETNIWRKVVASLESGLWWVKWIQGSPWLVLTPKGCKMSSNQLVGWIWMQDRVIE
jgi:hypothetical protein